MQFYIKTVKDNNHPNKEEMVVVNTEDKVVARATVVFKNKTLKRAL